MTPDPRLDVTPLESATRAAEYVRGSFGDEPEVALVLGSGLGAYADTIEDPVTVPYDTIPGFHVSTVVGHAGRLVAGRLHGLRVIAMQGRVHAYEGLSQTQVVLPLRTLGLLGARTVVITNAAGGVNPAFAPADLMLISDHLNLTGSSPLVGPNDDRLGPRFPDMTAAYDPVLRTLARAAAAELGIPLREGIYAGMIGPAYETPAEVRMVGALGGDAVGMSTVPEVIAARHMGMRVLGISCITNAAAGLGGGTLDHSEVTDVAARVRDRFTALLDRILQRMADR